MPVGNSLKLVAHGSKWLIIETKVSRYKLLIGGSIHMPNPVALLDLYCLLKLGSLYSCPLTYLSYIPGRACDEEIGCFVTFLTGIQI